MIRTDDLCSQSVQHGGKEHPDKEQGHQRPHQVDDCIKPPKGPPRHTPDLPESKYSDIFGGENASCPIYRSRAFTPNLAQVKHH